MWPAKGSWIQVSIKDGQVLQGRLFHLDSALQLVTIVAPVVPDDYESLPAPLRPSLKHTVQLVSTASVLDVQAISVAGGAASLDMPAVRPLKVERIMRREQKALQKRHAQFGSRAPSGTSEMAMQVFAALAKTYLLIPSPCHLIHVMYLVGCRAIGIVQMMVVFPPLWSWEKFTYVHLIRLETVEAQSKAIQL